MKTKDVTKKYSQYVLSTYRQTPVCVVKGKGSRVWDLEGKTYIDFFPGWGVSGLGHCPPEIVHALKHQSQKILHIPNNFLNAKQAELARMIVDASFPGKVFFCNSGAEATEAAIKFARKFGAASGRYEIITMRKSFHGRTSGAMAATAQEKIQKDFDPLLAGFRYAEFNDLASVEKLVNEKTVAVFLEPIQGEGGIHVASRQFLQGIRKLCDEKKMLLILDEVQTGMGRTGKLFGFQHYDIVPDLMTLAKSLGNGVPIGAMVVHEKVQPDIMSPGTHGSTYGGNPLVCAAALAVFKTIRKQKLLQHAQKMGAYLETKLTALKKEFPVIEEIRGIALMRALKLSVPGAPYFEAALRKGLIINCTQEDVLRIMPAINVTRKTLDEGLKILREVFREVTS